MTDLMFEQSLDRQIRAYADGGVQPFDRYAIAEELIKSGTPSSTVRLASGSRSTGPVAIDGDHRDRASSWRLVAAMVVGALDPPNAARTSHPGATGSSPTRSWDFDWRPYNYMRIVNADGTDDHEVAQGSSPRLFTQRPDADIPHRVARLTLSSNSCSQMGMARTLALSAITRRPTSTFPPDGSQVARHQPLTTARSRPSSRNGSCSNVAAGSMPRAAPCASASSAPTPISAGRLTAKRSRSQSCRS